MNSLLMPSPYDTDAGELIGRDPRTVPAADYETAGVVLRGAQAAIRAKCIDCSGGNKAEVRKCTATSCALWPWRMGSLPRSLRAAMRDEAEPDNE
jgi:hypothetical protein